jgi:TatD DNase family protein
MASDAHVHPSDLAKHNPDAEEERRSLNIACAASAWNEEDFSYNSAAAESPLSPPVALCFAVHPQLPAESRSEKQIEDSLSFLHRAALEKRIDAVGETGFDLFGDKFRITEKIQDALFAEHIGIAHNNRLPLVIHARKAAQKIFSWSKELKKIRAVVFHSYSGTEDEALSLLKRGVNAYFSFGNVLRLNHKQAMRACAALPAERLLVETDAPYQAPMGKAFSSYGDITAVIAKAAELRSVSGKPCAKEELESITDGNFYTVYQKGLHNE